MIDFKNIKTYTFILYTLQEFLTIKEEELNIYFLD